MGESVEVTVRELPAPAYPYVDLASVEEIPDRAVYLVPVRVADAETVHLLIPRLWAIARRWNDGAPIDFALPLFAGLEALDHLGNRALRVERDALPVALLPAAYLALPAGDA